MKTEKSCQNFQRRQSGLKSGGSWIRVKKFRFSREISEKFRFFQAIIFIKKSIFRTNLFQAIPQKNSIFQAKIGYLQLFLGKLFYFSSKVTTFEHTFCKI